MTVATLLLAAGSSSRLGQPKQLVQHEGQSLVRRMAGMALSVPTAPVVVVIGANADLVRAELTDVPVQTVVNADWSEGMGSSLRAGLTALADQPIDAFLVLLTDQPHVTPDLLRQLIRTRQETGKGIVACQYGEADHLGVPALFDRRYLPVFRQLTGDAGARKLIRQYTDDCAIVPFALGAIDLDTPQDLAAWQPTP
ncbi:molybdenum cofactor cytidylyltransferase [Spirosoma lacussanchae]|uniref:nucleotidyltransferase family protein n=1 Tax=Spirosoma lacussanchae TaxID=1884249 RepID=UPI001109F5BB|nr:nucleotidyltransferase family protein [Spirosoma lacussanchae]